MTKTKKSESPAKPAAKRRKPFRCLLVCALLALLAFFGINLYMVAYAGEYIYQDPAQVMPGADCILVLGAGVWGEGRPSSILQDRLETGLALYEAGASNRLLMSGDHGRKDYDEVNTMKSYAMEHGIPSAHVFMDHAGFSTYESMYRAREIFQVQTVLIVTQEFHLARAVYDARKLGLNAFGVQADMRQYSGRRLNAARESLARVKDFFYLVIQPKPTYLGEAIPVSGSGDLTNDKRYNP